MKITQIENSQPIGALQKGLGQSLEPVVRQMERLHVGQRREGERVYVAQLAKVDAENAQRGLIGEVRQLHKAEVVRLKGFRPFGKRDDAELQVSFAGASHGGRVPIAQAIAANRGGASRARKWRKVVGRGGEDQGNCPI